MGLFDRFKKKTIPSDPGPVSKLWEIADDPGAWDDLEHDEIGPVVLASCIRYGASQDGSLIPGLFALYRHAVDELEVSERLELLQQFCDMTEQQNGLGHMGLMMFLAADPDGAVQSSAALSLSVLFKPVNDPLEGPLFVIRTILTREKDPISQGNALGGVLLLGDKRLLPVLNDAWDTLGTEAQLAMSRARSNGAFVSEAMVEFWLGCLERTTDLSVFGSVAAALAKMPAISQFPFVVDVVRSFPAYASEEPMSIANRSSLSDHLRKIRPRLEALAAREADPKVIPQVITIWEDPECFKSLFA